MLKDNRGVERVVLGHCGHTQAILSAERNLQWPIILYLYLQHNITSRTGRG